MIQIQFEQEKQRAAAYDGAALIGRCEVQVSDTTWTITHTEVEPSYGGQGIARKLVLCVAEQAEKRRRQGHSRLLLRRNSTITDGIAPCQCAVC